MAQSLWIAQPIAIAALVAVSGLAGCAYEAPGYGGYDYGDYGYGGGQYYGYGGGQYYDYGGGQYYGNGYGNGDGYRDYGYGYRPRSYGYRNYEAPHAYPYRHQHRYGGNYCYYNSCNGDDDND